MLPKYMIVTTAFLFWAFYEMSGGAEFEPPEREVVVAEITPEIEEPQPVAEPVAVVEVAEVIEPVPAAEPQGQAQIILASFDDDAPTIAVIEPPATVEPVAVTIPDPVDIRLVAGDRVNMRDGPSTGFDVLDTLPRGTEAEVITVNGDGWAQIRLINSGKSGWMAERLLEQR